MIMEGPTGFGWLQQHKVVELCKHNSTNGLAFCCHYFIHFQQMISATAN